MVEVSRTPGVIPDASRVRVQRVGGITKTTVQGALQDLAGGSGGGGAVPTMRTPAFNATIPILTTDVEVGVSTVTSAVSVTLPSAAAWAATTKNGLDLTILDLTGNAATHNITPTLNGADTFLQGVTPVVTANFGSIRLRPSGSPITGWYVRGVN